MSPEFLGIAGFFILAALMLTGMSVSFVMTIVGLVGFAIIASVPAALDLAVRDFFSVFNPYNLTVLPLFILMGQIAFHSGISGRLFNTATKFLGHFRGGLAIATIGAAAGFSAVCCSTSATAATMASVALPEIKKYNYNPALATVVVAAGGSLGILIHPSIIFIIYGIMTEQSIDKLFLAGIIPGILLASFFMLSVLLWTRINPSLCPATPKATWSKRIKSLPGAIETMLLFVFVMGGLCVGFFTPTEAASTGALGTIIIALIGRNLSWNGFVTAVNETTRISCMIMLIVAGATVFGHFLAVTNIPALAGEWVANLDMNKYTIMVVIIFIYIILGCLMDSFAMIMPTLPVVYPVVMALGFDPIGSEYSWLS